MMDPAIEVASSDEAMHAALTSWLLRAQMEHEGNPQDFEDVDMRASVLLASARLVADREFQEFLDSRNTPAVF